MLSMARLAAAVAATLAFAACGDDHHHLHPEAGRDAPPPPWWRPELGTAKDWDIQLAPPYDLSVTRTMYDLDLFALIPSPTVVDYGDGDPVTFPMGALAGKLADLKNRGVKVICHVDTGAIHLSDPDARKFPGYEADPPDHGTPVKAGSVIGYSIDDDHLDERWLDIREASRPLWVDKMWKRLDLAKQIGCDGVDGDRNYSIDPVEAGWGLTDFMQSYSWYSEVAKQLHMRELSAGMRNGHTLAGQVDAEADDYDWMLIERCGEFEDCDTARPFLNKRYVVFAVDYQTSFDGFPNNETIVCGKQTQVSISEGLVKDADPPSSTYRHPCSP